MDTQNHNPREDDFDSSIVDAVIDSGAMELPAEFRRGFWDSIDKRFISILIGSIVFNVAFVTYFLLNPLPEEQIMMRVAKIQEQLAKRIHERELELEATRAKLAMNQPQGDKAKPEVKKPKADEPKPDKTAAKKSTKTKKAKSPRKSRQERRGSRGKSRQQIANAVSSRGVLALLTSSSTVAGGSEVADILTGKNHIQKDLDKAISGLSGLRTGGSGTTKATNVKGGRSRGGGGIDDLVSDLSETEGGGSFKRTGDLVSVGESALVGGGDGNGIIGRNQDDIQGIILKHNNSVQYCYQRELKRNPNLKGKLVVRFSITSQGTVKDVEVISSTLNNRKVERCVSNRIRRWSDFGTIDSSYGNTTVRQAYAFGY